MANLDNTMTLNTTDFTKNLNKAVKDTKQGADTMSTAIGGIGSAMLLLRGPIGWITAAIAAIGTGFKAMFTAEEDVNKHINLFSNLANSIGMTGEALLNQLKPAVKGVVSDLELMRSANDAIRLDIDHEFIPTMVAFANTNKKAGQSVVEAMEDQIAMVGRGSTEIADNYGIVTNASIAQERYAAEIGKTVAQLSAEEKQMARRKDIMNAMSEAVERQGNAVASTTDLWKKWWNWFKSEAIGGYRKYIVPIFDGLTFAIQEFITKTQQAITLTGAFFKAMGLAVTGKFIQASETMNDGMEKFNKIGAESIRIIKGITDAREAQRKAWEGGEDGSVPTAPDGIIPKNTKVAGDDTAVAASTKIANKTASKSLDLTKEMNRETIDEIKRFEEEKLELEEANAQMRLARKQSEREQEMQALMEWFNTEKELRLEHGVSTEELAIELRERKKELEASWHEEDMANEQERLAEREQMRQDFLNRSNDSSMSYVEQQKSIAGYIAQIRSGEISTESAYQDAYGSLLKNLPNIIGSSGKKVVAVMQGIEAAKGLIATYSGAAQAMATLPFPANIAAAAAIVSTGLGYVAQIGAAAGAFSGGGSSESSASVSSSSAINDTTDTLSIANTAATDEKAGSLTISILGDFIGDEEYVDMLAERITDAVKQRNVILVSSSTRDTAS